MTGLNTPATNAFLQGVLSFPFSFEARLVFYRNTSCPSARCHWIHALVSRTSVRDLCVLFGVLLHPVIG